MCPDAVMSGMSSGLHHPDMFQGLCGGSNASCHRCHHCVDSDALLMERERQCVCVCVCVCVCQRERETEEGKKEGEIER